MQRYGPDNAVTHLDREGRSVTLKSGQKIEFDALITTMPLDITLEWCGQKKWADGLTRRCALASHRAPEAWPVACDRTKC